MAVLCLVYVICAIRTNVIFFGILLPLPPAFALLAAANWYAGMGEMAYSQTLQIAAGALTFITDILGWYLFMSLLLASIDAPFQLPGKQPRKVTRRRDVLTETVFDLSTKIPGASQKSKNAERTEADLERG